ncbi:MAG: Maf family protein [Fimbriimonadaceae bacterium]|nr:Maf family protein [Fimbriimonadaceae bacterium]
MMQLPRPVILASASPRRQRLLAEILAEFTVEAAHLDEDALTVPDPAQTARDLALAKARVVWVRYPHAIVIGGDTVVALHEGSGARQLSKPVDTADAFRMLRDLSGRTHTVYTGIAIVDHAGSDAFVSASQVRFRDLGDAEIEAYIATGEPMDKAGAYGLQGLAARFIADVQGDRNTVVGLPVDDLRARLRHRYGAKD